MTLIDCSVYGPAALAPSTSVPLPQEPRDVAARTTAHAGKSSQLVNAVVGYCCVLVLCATAVVAQTITVTNVPANHYQYSYFPGNCPSGFNIPGGQYPPANHLERAHVIHNRMTGQWVLYAHYDSSNYTIAEVLVATSSSECGPYTVQSEFQPEGFQSRDENIFEDDDGSAYLITASNKYGGANDTMAIFKLTPDYLGIDSSAGVTWLFDHAFREAPAVVKSGGTYFLVTSQAAGWFPSQGGYAVSKAMMSGWSSLTNLGNSSTFGGQSSDILTIKGSQATTFVLVLDHLGGNTLRDTGSVWLPLLLDGTMQTATLKWYASWQVNTTTGMLTLPTNPNVAPGGTATATSVASTNPAQFAADGDYTTRWISASGAPFPASWIVDLGSVKAIEEVDLSWYMVKGSESYYKYKIDYSIDGANFSSIDRTGNQLYGFTSDPVSLAARYVRIELTGFVCQNGCTFYNPSLYEVQLLQAPASSDLPVNVQVAPSASPVSSPDLLMVAVSVSGGSANPMPTGTVTLAGSGYSATYGLLGGSALFTIPAGALTAGSDTLTATYTPDSTSAPIYGTAPSTGTGSVSLLAVPNLSFETPKTASFVYNPAGGSWTFSGSSASGVGSGVTTNNSGFTTGDSTAPDGTQVAFLQKTGSITQAISGFHVGQSYKIMVAASQRQNKSGGQVGNTFDIRVNGTTIGSFSPSQAVASYVYYSATFTATSPSNTIAFVGTNANGPGTDNTVFLDNVQILAEPR